MQSSTWSSLLFTVLQEGPFPLSALVFVIVCTASLLVTRIRRCIQPLPANPVRDIALLLSGPVVALVNPMLNAMSAGPLVSGGIDAGLGIRSALIGPSMITFIGFECFVVGVIACCLPTKQPR